MSSILNEIKEQLQHHGYVTRSAYPIDRGLMHKKWIAETSKGALFIKWYNPARYRKRALSETWNDIEFTLQLQKKFTAAHGSAPVIIQLSDEEQLLQTTPSGHKFVVMEKCRGQMVSPGTFNEKQLLALGQAVSRLHHVWNELDSPLPAQQPLWEFQYEDAMNLWEQRWELAKSNASDEMKSALQLQKEIINGLEIEHHQPSSRPGWSHLDLWADNLLFDEQSLCGILDFDRARYSYPILDIGRAVLSGCLSVHGMRPDAAAFIQGYRDAFPCEDVSLLQAVRYTWLIESFWWFNPHNEPLTRVPQRFFNEMYWIANHWDALDSFLH